jgi:hypothetical protein
MCGAPGVTPLDFIIPVVRNGNGAVPSTGILAGDYRLPFGFTLRGASIMGDQVGSAEFDIWIKSFDAASPPDVSNSICGGNYPALVAGVAVDFATLTGWTTKFGTDQWIRWNLRSISSITFFTLQLQARRLI